ncbi:MAG: TenA family protein, partial [Brachybacterium sp.]|nr:TenA family protein [Brachybacterium sp.]
MTTTPIDTTIDIDPASPVGRLYATADESWRATVEHRFVRELFAGTIEDDVLAGYLVQDYQFFDAFLSMLGACVAHADQVPPKLRFSAQLGMLAADENDYFQDSFDELGVAATDRTDPQLTPTTAAFRDLMLDAVESGDYAHLLVMLVIAEWIYLDWGERTDPMPERAVHTGWIDLHRGEDFRGWVQFLVDELNRVAPTGDEEAMAALVARWQQAVQLELDF